MRGRTCLPSAACSTNYATRRARANPPPHPPHPPPHPHPLTPDPILTSYYTPNQAYPAEPRYLSYCGEGGVAAHGLRVRRLPTSAEPCPFWTEPLLPPEPTAQVVGGGGGGGGGGAALLDVPLVSTEPAVLAGPGGPGRSGGAEKAVERRAPGRGLAWSRGGGRDGQLARDVTDELQPGLYCVDANMLQVVALSVRSGFGLRLRLRLHLRLCLRPHFHFHLRLPLRLSLRLSPSLSLSQCPRLNCAASTLTCRRRWRAVSRGPGRTTTRLPTAASKRGGSCCDPTRPGARSLSNVPQLGGATAGYHAAFDARLHVWTALCTPEELPSRGHPRDSIFCSRQRLQA